MYNLRHTFDSIEERESRKLLGPVTAPEREPLRQEAGHVGPLLSRPLSASVIPVVHGPPSSILENPCPWVKVYKLSKTVSKGNKTST